MKQKKRVLAVLLAAAMMASMLPAGAWAAGDEPPAARSKKLAASKTGGAVTAAAAPSGSTPGAAWNGTYVVSSSMSLSNVTVTGNTTVYIAQGVTLTVSGSLSTTAQTGNSTSASTTPAAVPNAPGGRNGITIISGTLTFTGPGNLIVTGGAGARGADSTENNNFNMNNGGGGGRGGDGVFVASGATLKFAETFTGTAAIRGGNGGAGGTGQQASAYVVVQNNNARSYSIPATNRANRSGNGGNGGYAGYGIAADGGTVIFAQDAANTTLSKEGNTTIGSINVKGGVGGTGGTAGTLAAGTGIASNIHGVGSNVPSSSAVAQANAQITSQGAQLTSGSSWSKTGESNGSYTVNYSVAGSGGVGGLSGYGIGGGTVKFEGGVTGIEGGNSGGTSATWNVITGTHNYFDNGVASAASGIKKTPNPDGTETQISLTGGPVNGYNQYSCLLTASAVGTTYGVAAVPAISGATVYNNGGMSYVIYGDDGAGSALTNATVKSEGNKTGSFYNGNGVNMAPNVTSGITAVRVNYLEGTGDFAGNAKNFYVLNKSDTWTDADGTKHTSEGLLVGGTAYITKDLYVSPQGYLYLSGINNGATIEFDLAVGATRDGVAGSAAKDIHLSAGSQGIYHFTGTTAGVTARYALDDPDTGASYDSSFDVHWLQGVDFTKTVEISTAPQLAAVAWAVNNGVPGAATAGYKLTKDLNLGNFDWTPIGTESNPFMGTFDGQNHTLYNLRVSKIDGVTGYGLFGWAEDAALKNFTLARSEMTAAHADTLKNNGVAASATSGGAYDFKAVSAIKAITADTPLYVGAALGHGVGSTVDKVTVTDLPIGKATGQSVSLGGLVGYAQKSNVTGSMVTNTSDHTLSASAAGDAYTGGMIGWADETDVTKNSASGYTTIKAESTTTGHAWAGGAIGKLNGTTEKYAVATNNQVSATSGTVSATSKSGDACAAGLVGQAEYANVKGGDGTFNTADGYTTVQATSTATGSAWAGGAVGRVNGAEGNFAIVVNNEVKNAGTVSATSKDGDAYAAGLVGEAMHTDVTKNSAAGCTAVTAAATNTGAAWAAGAIGFIQGNDRTAAVATNNTVSGTKIDVTATAKGAEKNAAAGGILGEGKEVAAYSNAFTETSDNTVTAYSPAATAWAGGLLGHVENQGFGRIAVSDMKVPAVAVTAKGDASNPAGKASYAGGVIGQGRAKNGVELVNLTVGGTGANGAITSNAAATAWAGRLAGQVNKATIINCAFTNEKDQKIDVAATSTGSDAYAAGLVGQLLESGSVNASGVWATNVSASAAADKTAWAGGLLGYADDTSITASSVNYKKPATGEDAENDFAASTITVTGAKTTYAGGIAGEIVNTIPLNKPGEHTYKMNNAVSVTMTLPNAGVTAGGLYGKLNDGLVGTSYARDYIITSTGNSTNANPPTGNVAGVAGVLNGSELIAVYGVGKGGTVISAYPGMYAEGGNNAFYGCYVLHDKFAPRPERDVNVYGNTYYVKNDGSFTLIPGTQKEAQEQGKELVEKKAQAVPYYTKGSDGLYELKTSYDGVTYQHTQLTGLPTSYFNNDSKANDSMWNLLHFYRDDDPSAVTTRFEQRLGYAISFNRKSTNDVPNNFKCPTFVTPYAFTLAVQPGLDYGHIKENKGDETYSTYNEPGTKTYTADTQLIFTAEEQPTLPQDKVFYVFTGWKYASVVDTYYWKINENGKPAVDTVKIPASVPATVNPIRVNSVASYMTLTALFERRDNQIRGEINKALSDAMKAVTQDPDFVAELNELLAGGFPQDAADAMLDQLYAADETSGEPKLKGVYDAFEKWVDTDLKTDLSDMDFGTIYPNAKEELWDDITDHQAVVKQIVRDAVEQMMAADRFQAGSYDTDITEIAPELTDEQKKDFTKGDKLDFVDVGVDLFTTGNFAKYEETQLAFEKSGAAGSTTDNTKPGIGSFTGTTATLTDLLGGKGSVAISYIDPAGVGANGVYTPKDENGQPIEGEDPYDIWNAVPKNSNSKYTYDIDTSKLVTAEDGKQYLYIRETDANGYQVTTRVEVGVNTVVAENAPVNAVTGNTGVGDGTVIEPAEGQEDVERPLRYVREEMWFGAVNLAKGEKGEKLGAESGDHADEAGKPYYHNGKGGDKDKSVFTSTPSSGAYTEGLYVEIAADRVADWTKLPGYDVDPAVSTVKEIFGEDGVTVTGYEVKLKDEATTLTSEQGLISKQDDTPSFSTANVQPDVTASPVELAGSITYEPVNGFTVKAKYVNLLGELNQTKEGTVMVPDPNDPTAPPVETTVTAQQQVDNVLNDEGFAGAMGVDGDVITAYKGMTKTDAEGVTTNPIGQVMETYTPTEGYPDADAVKDLFTRATALQELLDVMAENQDTMDSLSAADKTRVAELKGRADNLLSGKDYNGNPIDPDDLALNSALFYNTGDNLFKLLQNVYYDSVVITIQTNFGGYVKPATGGQVGQVTSFVEDTLFGQDKVGGLAANAMSLFAENGILDSVAYVVGKGKEAKLVLDQKFYADGYEISSVNGEPNNGFFTSASAGADWTATISADKTVNNLNYTILFAKRVYDVTIPTEVKDSTTTSATVEATASGTSLEKETVEGEETGNLTGSVTHGDSVTIKVTPAEGYSIVPGGEVTYTVTLPNGSTKSETAKLNPDGTVVLSNAEGTISDVALSGAVAKTDKDGLGGYLTEAGKLVRDNYTPESWTKFDAAKKAADEVKTKANIEVGQDGSYENEEAKKAAIETAYQDLIAAQKALVKQYTITPGNDFEISDLSAGTSLDPTNKGDIDTLYGSNVVTYYQNGVVKIGSNYYVQEGKEVELEPTGQLAGQLGTNGTKSLVGVTYAQGDTEGKKATLVTGNNHIIIPNVTGAVDRLKAETKDKTFTVLPGDKDTTGKTDTTTVPSYDLPDVSVDNVTGTPETMTVTIKDEGNRNFVIEVPIDGNNGKTSEIKVKAPGDTEGKTIAVTANSLDGIVTDSDQAKKVELTSAQLQAIVDAYNNTTKPQIVVGKDTKVSGQVTSAASTPEGEDGGTFPDIPVEQATSQGADITVPTYTVTPKPGEHVTGVTVDKKEIPLPTDAEIQTVINGDHSPADNSDGTKTYTKTDPATGEKTTVTTDGVGGKPLSVTVDPGVDAGVTVTFPVDLTSPDYGKAEVVWKAPNNNTHTVTAKTEANVYDFTSKKPDPSEGTALVKTNEAPGGADKGQVTHGNSAELVIAPAGGMRVDPNGKVTITMAGVQGGEAVTITDTLKNLADKNLYPNLTVTGVNRDCTVNAGASVTVAVSPVTGPLTVDASGAFRSATDLDPEDMVHDLTLALDGLKQSIDLGDAIVKNKDNGPYVTSDTAWKNFAGATDDKGGKLADASEKLYDKLTKDDDLLETIAKATTETALVDAVNKALGLTGVDKLDTFTQVVNAVTSAKDDLDDAILNLTPKSDGGKQIPILPGLTGEGDKPILGVGTEGAVLLPGETPDIIGSADDGGLTSSEELKISPVTPKPGNTVDKVTITVTDPTTGKEYTAEIPVNGGTDVGENGIVITDKATGAVIAPEKLPGGAIAGTVDGGTAKPDGTVSVPGGTIQAVVDAITGTKNDTTGNPTAGSGDGVVTGVDVSTKRDNGFDVGVGPTHTDAKTDGGITGNKPKVDTVDSDKNSNSGTDDKNTTIDPGEDGITVTPIKPGEGFTYEGLELTVVVPGESEDKTVTVFIPKDTDETTGNTTQVSPSDVSDGYTTTVTPDELAQAIKDATGLNDITGVIVTDVKVVTDAIDVPAITPEPGNGIDEVGEVDKVTVKPGATDGTESLTIPGVKPAPGFTADGGTVTVTVTDPITGKEYTAEIPVNGGADTNGGIVVKGPDGEVIAPEDLPGGAIPDDTKGATSADASDGKENVTIPGDTLNAIIDAITGSKDNGTTIPGSGNGVISGLTVDGKREGHALPESGNATGDKGVDGTPTITNTDKVLLPDTEDLVVGNIKPKENFQVDGLTVTLSDGTKVTLPKDDGKEETGAKVTVTVTTPDGVSETKDIPVPNETGVTFEESGGTGGTGKITVDGDALEAIIKAALGDESPDGVADADITDVKVNTSAKPDVIGLPETAGTDEHQTGAPTVEVTDENGDEADAIIDPETPTGSVVIGNIKPDPAFSTKDVTITVTVPTADGMGTTDYEVTIPIGEPAPDLSKLPAYPVKPDGAVDKDNPVTVDLSDLTDKGGLLDQGGGANGSDLATIPTQTIADIIDKLTPEYTGQEPDPRPAGTVAAVDVNTGRTGHTVPGHTNTMDDGVDNKGIVQVWTNNPTGEPSKLEPSKGLTVTGVEAQNEGETVANVTITTAGGTVITVTPDGTVTAVKDGEELVLGAGIKADITDADGDPATTEPFDLALSGAVLDTILAAAGEESGAGSIQKVEVNTTKPDENDPAATVPGAPGEGTLTGWLSAAVADPCVVDAATQDLVVDNVKVAPGYTYTGVTLTLTDGTTVSVPKQSVTAADGRAQVTVTITQPDGTTTETKPVLLPQHVKSGTDLSNGTEKTTIPGASLDEIIKAALGTNDSDVVRVDIDAEATGYVMPTAKTIKDVNVSHGLDGLTIKNDSGDDADQSAHDDAVDNHIVVPHTGELVMELTYQKDDDIYGEQGQTYHTFSGLTVGDVSFDADTLERLGVIDRENSDALAHLSDPDETITLDAQKLAAQYKLATGKDFPGFGDLSIQTVPQNSQYASFVENYETLQGMLDENGKPTGGYAYGGADRAEYEELVQKLADQFKTGTADELKGDNLAHLLDKKVVLDGLQQEIDDLRKADQTQEGIDNTTDGVETALGDKATSVKDAADKLNGIAEATDEEKQAIIDAIGDDLLDDIRNLVNDSAKLPDSAKDEVWTGGLNGTTADKLDDLEALLEAVERSSLTANEYLNKVLNDLPEIPNILGGDGSGSGVPDNDDGGSWDSLENDATGTLTARINALKAAEAAINKAAEKIEDTLVGDGDEADSDTSITTDQRNALLDRLSVQQEKLTHELEDLAKVFAKNYLTIDDSGYNSAGTSTESSNGIKESTPKIKDLASTGMAAYNKLPPSVQEAVDDLFYGPTLPELNESVFATGSTSAGLLDKEGIFNALDKDSNHINSNHLNVENLGSDSSGWSNKVDPSGKAVGQWVDDILALEPSYNALTSGDQDSLNDMLTGQNGSRYPDLLDRANGLVADKFVKDNHLNDLGPAGDTLTQAQKDLVSGAKWEWNSLTDEQKALVNDKVSGITGGPNYEDLLGMLTPGSSTGSGVTVTQRPGGTVSVNPEQPKKGDTVTITVTPNSGYTANAPTVKDKDGNAVTLTKQSDGSYTFTMPDGKVTVTGSFTKKDNNSGDTPSQNPGTGGSGGGSSSNVTVEVGKTEHGAAAVDSDTAKKDDTVTITVTPDLGYVVDRVTVTDKNGNELPLTDHDDGTYTYTQPSGKVTVDVLFRPVTGDPHDNGVADLLNTDDHAAYMQGRDGGVFAPGENMTRAEAAQMFYNLLKDKNVPATASFTDVDSNAWYAKAVSTLAGLDILSGVGGGAFAPDRTITRAEFVVIATRFARLAPGDAKFSDVSGDFWAREAIGTASYYGWIDGYPDGTFQPLNLITRAEAVKVVNAMLDRSADRDFVDANGGNLIRFPDVPPSYWAYYDIMEAANAHGFTRTDGAETWTK